MCVLKHVSTDAVPPRQRTRLWQETMKGLFGPLDSKSENEGTLAAHFNYGTLGGMPLCRLRSEGWMRLVRTESAARASGSDFVKVSLQIRGTSYNEQRGRTVALSPGHWCVKEIGEPYSVLSPSDADVLLLVLPRGKVASKRYRLEDLVARSFSGQTGVGKLAFESIGSAFDGLSSIKPEFEKDVLETIIQFIRLAMLEVTGAVTPLSMKLVLEDRIKTYIDGHLRDPDLRVDHLAQVFNCSKRYLHKAFESQGTSIGKYILGLRLERCREELRNSAHIEKSVTDIAYSWGFNSANHFSRSFKEEYGLCPRELRAESAPASMRKHATHHGPC
jgi:AraC family transcriptional regulator, positive regulator of tynA and feaB